MYNHISVLLPVRKYNKGKINLGLMKRKDFLPQYKIKFIYPANQEKLRNVQNLGVTHPVFQEKILRC